ncbi:TRAP transporter substrate-binding protein [Neomoorella thermoacetica]|uniref:TRAP transporter substrate-binding protein n=1 Tax=Neomoorella thermoacetica TaxID=1525 RepID=UPI000919175E|nr:TRAP transporter substrate-binding protein [Moorella thermoacetica]OIQ60800.1 2,3-diketo-L-gulonate-binding periplasmic protein YiaO precursor [Moorella thermoacetica]
MFNKQWKKCFIISIIVILILGLTACGQQSGSNQSTGSNDANKGQKLTLRLADNQPEDYPTVVGDKEFARLVKERTNGRINIEVYPNAALGDEKTAAEQVQLGAIDFLRGNTGTFANFAKEIDVFNLPFLFSSKEQMWKVLNGPVGEKLLEALKPAKMVGLTYYDSGARGFYNSKHPVTKPSDLAGMKIRVQPSPMFMELVQVLGASPTPMSMAELYSALQTGVVDGAENNYPTYYTQNHYKVAKYYTEDNHTRNPEMLVASLATWNKLSPDDQKIILQAAKDSQIVERKAWDELEAKAKKAAIDNGCIISQIDISEWQKAVQPIYDKYGQQFKDLIDQIRAVK